MKEEKREKEGKEKKKVEPKAKALYKKQLDLLYLAFCFRFVTIEKSADYMHIDQSTVRLRLATLQRQDYLGRLYDGSYKIHGRSAEYYLTPKSIPALRSSFSHISESELHGLHKRPSASRRHVERSLAILDIRNQLVRLYDHNVDFAAKPLLNIEDFDYLPRPLPDAYLTLNPDTPNEQACFLEYFDDGPSVGVLGYQISKYMDYRESGEWDESELAFPTVVIVCQSLALMGRIEKRIRFLERQQDSEITFRLIDLPALRSTTDAAMTIWIDPIEKTTAVKLIPSIE